LKFSAPPAV